MWQSSILRVKDIMVGRTDEKAYAKLLREKRIARSTVDYEKLAERGKVGKKVLVVSFYTPDYYEPMKRLRRSLAKFGLDFKMYERKERGDWYSHVRHKPAFIKERLDEFPDYEAVCWIDVDGEILSFPHLLFNVPTDLAFHWHNWHTPFGGTMLFKNTETSRELIDVWQKELDAEANKRQHEQRSMGRAIEKMDIPWTQLPMAYGALWRRGRPPAWCVIRLDRWGREK